MPGTPGIFTHAWNLQSGINIWGFVIPYLTLLHGFLSVLILFSNQRARLKQSRKK